MFSVPFKFLCIFVCVCINLVFSKYLMMQFQVHFIFKIEDNFWEEESLCRTVNLSFHLL